MDFYKVKRGESIEIAGRAPDSMRNETSAQGGGLLLSLFLNRALSADSTDSTDSLKKIMEL